VESLAGLLVVVSMAAGFAGFKKVAAVWNAETCRGFSGRAVPVLVKYTWGQRALDFLTSGDGVEEMALAAWMVPVVLATMAAVKSDMAVPEPEPEKKSDTVILEPGGPLEND
jgi:hypothetical protein